MNLYRSQTLADFWALKFSAGGQPVTRIFSQRLGAVLAWMAYQVKISPNMVTSLALSLSVMGAFIFAFAPPVWGGSFLALIAFELAYGLDCADGQLARALSKCSAFGGWWDVYADFMTIVVIGIAIALHLLVNLSVATETGLLAAGVFVMGSVGSLHSSNTARQWNTGSSGMPKKRGFLQGLAAISVDTPVVLAALCFLRHWASLLILYLVVQGVLLIAHSLFTAHRHAPA